jgi:hypothetical protein
MTHITRRTLVRSATAANGGMNYGFARVSTDAQDLTSQLSSLINDKQAACGGRPSRP